jgi:hypothetical protein
MAGAAITVILWLSLAEAEASKQSAVRRFWWAWVGLLLVGLLLVRIVAAIGKRRRQAIESSVKAEHPKAIKDAWTEAGKRAEPIPEEDVEEPE